MNSPTKYELLFIACAAAVIHTFFGVIPAFCVGLTIMFLIATKPKKGQSYEVRKNISTAHKEPI